MKTIITIGREYGSGGKEIGEKLAAALGIPCYDKELLTEAARESGIREEMFESNDEKPTGSFLYSLVMGGYGGDNLPFNHKLFLAQFDAIRSIADRGGCVIIGRCADYALEDYKNCLNVFIHANMPFKVERAVKYYDVARDKAESVITKTDKSRASYYNFYSGRKWGSADNYHLTLDSSVLGIDNTVEIIKLAVGVLENGKK
ncbi:MAG: cytidylate kinase-like family protein [Firmicutes bacterium]|nr:cytidylate kinase-like family protein [Bacillota bacterium]